jgi:hypothetical protein
MMSNKPGWQTITEKDANQFKKYIIIEQQIMLFIIYKYITLHGKHAV